jgi:Derlin-2/3
MTKTFFLAPSLSFMIVYIWGRRNPHSILNLFGVLQFNAPYLPWVLLGFGLLLDQSPISDILGILAGHIYYFFEDVYPRYYPNRKLLKTPEFVYVF